MKRILIAGTLSYVGLAMLGLLGLAACSDDRPEVDSPSLEVGDPDVEALWAQSRTEICGLIAEAESYDILDRGQILAIAFDDAGLNPDQERIVRDLVDRDC